jgi:hypothetical protein
MSYTFNNVSINGILSGSGSPARRSVLVATTAAGTLATDYENGDTLDGILLSTNDRILIKNQASGIENGIYIVQASGAPVRAEDFDINSNAAGNILFIQEGTVNSDTGWICTNNTGSDIVGTDSLTFAQLTGTGVDGNVYGPASSTNNAIAKYNGTDGKTIQDSGLIIDGSNNLSGINTLILESGTFDTIISAATQTVGAPTLTIPDLAGTSGDLLINNATQTLTNKTLTLPVIASISNSGTITIPTGTDTLVARDTTDTLTNKTLTSTTNTVRATQLGTAGSDVNVSSASAPTVAQVLQATSGTTSTWQYRGWRESVRVATTVNGTLTTDFENGDTIDGIILATNNRILIKDQSTATENGIYVVQASGSPVRASDYNTGSSVAFTYVFVQEGTVNNGTFLYCSNISGSDIVGTDNLSFSQIGASSPALADVLSTGNTTGGNDIVLSGASDTINFTRTNNLILDAASVATADRTITFPDPGANDSVVYLALSQTLTNKTLTLPIIASISNSGTITIPTGTDTLVARNTTDTLTNKTLTLPVIASISNSGTITIPTGTDTLVARNTTDTLTNKTLTLPVIASISNSGTITVPTGTDTLVARNTTDTLTNKTLTLPVIASISNSGTITIPTGTDTLVARNTTDTLTNKTITSSTNTVRATQLGTSGSDVNVSSASAPTTGQVLQATSGTTSTWQYRGWRAHVVVATTVTGVLSTAYENGDTVDGVVLATGDRILLKNQTDATENGIYVVNASGSPTRAADYPSGMSASSTFMFVTEGTTNGNTGWFCTSNDGIDVVGTHSLSYQQFSDASGGGGEVNTASNVGVGGVGLFLQKSGVNLEFKNINAGSSKITVTNDAVNNEIDIDVVSNNISGNIKPVRAATTANGALATAFENGDTIDGVTLSTGDRILLKNQTTGTENGVYTVNASGAPTRAADFTTGDSVSATLIAVKDGFINRYTMWLCSNSSTADVVGTDSLTFRNKATQIQNLSSGEVTANSSSYVTVVKTVYSGSNKLSEVRNVTAIVKCDAGTTADVRLQDITNVVTIASGSTTSTSEIPFALAVTGSFPTGLAIWELQIARLAGTGNSKVYCYGCTILM